MNSSQPASRIPAAVTLLSVILAAAFLAGPLAASAEEAARDDADLEAALRRGVAEYRSQRGWGDPGVRALVETGATGRRVAEDLSRSRDGELKQMATALLAMAESKGGWDALQQIDRLAPPPRRAPERDPAREERELDELEAQLPRLEKEFPGDWRPTGCGNSSIDEYSSNLAAYVRLGRRACPSLGRLLHDPSADRRLRALQVLAVVDCPGREQLLVEALGDADPRACAEAVSSLERLGKVGDHRAALRRLLDEPPCRAAVAGALARCGDAAALPVLLASARAIAESGDASALPRSAWPFDDLSRLTSWSAPGRGDPYVQPELIVPEARWWTEWGATHARGFDVAAAHRDALRMVLDEVRRTRRGGRPEGRWPDLSLLLAADAPGTLALLFEDVELTMGAGFDIAAALRTSGAPAGVLDGLESICRGPDARASRREALRVLAALDPERARSVIVALLRSERPEDRAAAWGDVSGKLAPDEMRRVTLAMLPGAEAGAAKEMYWALLDLAVAADCDELMPLVVSETDVADRIAGWGLLARLQCPAAKEAMRARLADPEIGSWLAGAIAAYHDVSVIPDLPGVSSQRATRAQPATTLQAVCEILRLRTVPGLVHALESDQPAIRFGAAVALREAARERPKYMFSGHAGETDLRWERLSEPYVRAALERAASRPDDAASAVASGALALMGPRDAGAPAR